MNALVSTPREPLPSDRPSGPLLRTLVLCDLADSTALIERLGDQGAATLIRKHDRLARDLVQRHAGQEIDKTDGFLVLFERPIQGVAFALDYQRELQQLGKEEHLDLRARVGVHVGDVVVWENNEADVAHGAKPIEVEGLVKPVAARLASLALPGQVLASGVAANLAQRAHGELGDKEESARWINHGRYRFKGVPEPLQVYEIGEPDFAPLSAPPWSSKAHREVPWWRRPATVAIEATLLIGCLAASAWWALRPPAAIAFAERDWVVVGSLKNLTGGATFDDAVDTAFRLGLEQSRYVNVLSDLKVRETIGLMQRDPDKTVIDRAIGSEVALRDGARALILPTVAEIGGKVRITAEVVDPETQATVYSESADGSGAGSVLGSIDQINARLRERLGEALASVSKESQPLDKAATRNLDALRAFTLAQRAYDVGKTNESVSLYRQAAKLDPHFGMAHTHLARSLLVVGQRSEAVAELQLAMAERERLSSRDALYVEAWSTTLSETPRAALDKWRVLAKLYPDFFSAQSLYSYFSWELANRFDKEIVAAAERSASPQNAHQQANNWLLGLLYLSNEQPEKAAQRLQLVQDARSSTFVDNALPYAARKMWSQADAKLNEKRGDPSMEESDVDHFIPRVAIAYDSDHKEKAWEILAKARETSARNQSRYTSIFRGMELGLRALESPSLKGSEALSTYLRDVRDALAKAGAQDRVDAQFQMLFAAYLAAHVGEVDMAQSLVRSVGPEPASGDWPMLNKLLQVAQAEIHRANGKFDEAAKLKTTFDGSELYLAHAVLRDTYLGQGDADQARGEAGWMAEHRGRAYAEINMHSMLMPLNVALSNLARNSLPAQTKLASENAAPN